MRKETISGYETTGQGSITMVGRHTMVMVITIRDEREKQWVSDHIQPRIRMQNNNCFIVAKGTEFPNDPRSYVDR